jgi:hypothetical protein
MTNPARSEVEAETGNGGGCASDMDSTEMR